MKVKINNNKGITLVALIVTVIILLILAGISIASLVGDNSLIEKSREAKNETIKKMEEEQIQIACISLISEKKEIIRENLENELKSNKANILGVDDEDENLRVTFETGNIYYVDKDGNFINIIIMSPEIAQITKKPEEETTTQFNKSHGVIEIAWLNENNDVIKNPIKITENELGGMIPVKWQGNPGSYTESETTVSDSDWYKYEVQTEGTQTGGTSRWANAKAKSGANEAYFVWIPRYSYKIIYFDTRENKENYKEDNTNQTGIIGYSTIYGMVDVTEETPKLVEGTNPINIVGNVKTEGYKDYIVHPAFEFDGAKKGIWVGKYEPSGNLSAITIKPNVTSIVAQNIGNIFTATQNMKTMYGLTGGDTHMMKNVEWGSVSYLTESKYGRNGTEITINNSESYFTGRAGESVSDIEYSANGTYQYNTPKGVLASTTGNIYGIYDMSRWSKRIYGCIFRKFSK